MTVLLTVGMWTHVYLNGLACHQLTENPIWGELRLIPVVVSTIALWVVLGTL